MLEIETARLRRLVLVQALAESEPMLASSFAQAERAMKAVAARSRGAGRPEFSDQAILLEMALTYVNRFWGFDNERLSVRGICRDAVRARGKEPSDADYRRLIPKFLNRKDELISLALRQFDQEFQVHQRRFERAVEELRRLDVLRAGASRQQ
ncbi:MAG: hypothetical protein KIS96_06240 [Bauldia sp.]|nr:hypothetical protein [Bauldia sp.]